MLHRVVDGLNWRWLHLRRYLYLVCAFRNGLEMVQHYRRRIPCPRAVLWNGCQIEHSPDRLGLVETILEIWNERVYTGNFYKPADGDVIVDAGANVGLFSVWLARRYPRCRIVAFEPFAENYELLVRNIRASGVQNVQAFRMGLGGVSGHGRMEAVGQRSLDHRLRTSATPTDDDVPVLSFADVLRLADTDRIALFKCDIEGSEGTLLQGSERALLERVDKWAIEYHDNLCPGTLDLLQSCLGPTHQTMVGTAGQAYGMLYATRRPVPAPDVAAAPNPAAELCAASPPRP